MTRAKFKCDSINRSGYSKIVDGKPVKVEMRTVRLTPVYGNGDPNHENTRFWEASPSGQIELGCVNLAAAEMFDIGKEYYVDFSPAGE